MNRIVKLVLIAAGVILLLFLIPAYQGTRSKTLIAETFKEGFDLKTRLEEFYDKQHKLPLDAEAKVFQMGPSDLNRAQSVVWDPVGRRIIIAVDKPQSESGKRFTLHAEERDGTLTWTCRTIDLEVKYLPASCR